jgi:hypothetical protein
MTSADVVSWRRRVCAFLAVIAHSFVFHIQQKSSLLKGTDILDHYCELLARPPKAKRRATTSRLLIIWDSDHGRRSGLSEPAAA